MSQSSSPLQPPLMKPSGLSPKYNPSISFSLHKSTSSYGKEKDPPDLSYPPESIPCQEVPQPSPSPDPMANFPSLSHITYIPSYSPSPVKFHHLSKGKDPCSSASPQTSKLKNPCTTMTPPNYLVISPTNSARSYLDFLLKEKSLELCPLSIHKPGSASSPNISPNSASNITVRRKQNRQTRHFCGRKENPNMDNSLIDIPIIDLSNKGPLGARLAEAGPS